IINGSLRTFGLSKVRIGQARVCNLLSKGFLMKVDGDKAYFVTNHHVIDPSVEITAPESSWPRRHAPSSQRLRNSDELTALAIIQQQPTPIAEFLREARGLKPEQFRELTAHARRLKEHARK